MFVAWWFSTMGLQLGEPGGIMQAAAVFSFGLVAFGFLGMGPVTIAVDSYGPVTDNAQSVYELSLIESVPNIKEEVKKDFGFEPNFEKSKHFLEENDGAGNTFKATAKPVLIGTAVVGATTMIFSIMMVLTDGLRANRATLSLLHAPRTLIRRSEYRHLVAIRCKRWASSRVGSTDLPDFLAGSIEPDERPSPKCRVGRPVAPRTHAVDERAYGRRGQRRRPARGGNLCRDSKWVPAQGQTVRVEGLRNERSFPAEHQMPGGYIRRGGIRFEQAPRLRSIEVAHEDRGRRGTGRVKQEVTTIREELRQLAELRRLPARGRRSLATIRGDSVDRRWPGEVREENRAVPVPRSAGT